MKKPQKLENKTKYYHLLIWAGLWFAQIALFQFLGKTEFGVVWAQKLFSATASVRTSLFAWIPISVGDIFYLVVVLYFLKEVFLIFRRNKIKLRLKRLLVILNIIFLWYQLFWGLLYFQPGLLSREDLAQPLPIGELKTLSKAYLKKCATTREKIQDSIFKIDDIESLKTEIQIQQTLIAQQYGKQSRHRWVWKESLYQSVLSYTGISGYYNPFSSEAQFNPQLPATNIPFTLAHESAHQLGFSYEEEANFIAFLTAENTQRLDLKYSVDWMVLKMLLSEISTQDPGYVENMLQDLPKKIQQDYHAEQNFVRMHYGRLSEFFSFTNDLFLKSNQQDGVANYQYFLYLLLDHEKRKGL